MATVLPVPMISQLTPVSWDGTSPNDQMDCVPTSILAGMMGLLGIKQVDAEWNPDHILDMAYKEGYKGGTDAEAFIPVCAKFGIKLSFVNGVPGDLVTKTHAYLQQGCPVVVTVPDNYSTAPGMTHVLCMYAEGPDYLIAMDPYPLPGTNAGHPIHHTDQQWTELLLFNQIWILEKEDEVLSIDLNVPEVAAHFKQQSATSWICLQTGKAVHDAMLTFYRSFGRSDCCGLTWLGLPESNEIQLGGGATKQHFERGVLVYDPTRKIDNPPGSSGPVYLAHLYDGGVGTDPVVVDLEKQITALKAQPGATPDPQAAAALSTVKQIQALVKPF